LSRDSFSASALAATSSCLFIAAISTTLYKTAESFTTPTSNSEYASERTCPENSDFVQPIVLLGSIISPENKSYKEWFPDFSLKVKLLSLSFNETEKIYCFSFSPGIPNLKSYSPGLREGII